MHLKLIVLKDKFAVYKFNPGSGIPGWIEDSDFYSVTKTKDELSVVCRQTDEITDTADANYDWRIIKVSGPLEFSLVGIIAEISGILKENNISVFTISTYDTDYFLVKNNDFEKAINSLKDNGHQITYES